jgi:hypothetical protein
MRCISLSAEAFQQSPTGDTPALGPAAHEIEQAIDDVCRQDHRYAYDLPMEPQYMFDPLYSSDRMLLILSWSMPEPFWGA